MGYVAVEGRGALPFALVHGESLVATASWALGEAGVRILDFNLPWSAVQAASVPLVLHDSLCPLTPVAFLRSAVETAEQGGVVVAMQGETVTSPVVLAADVVAGLDAWPDASDFAGLIRRLSRRFALHPITAPPTGARVTDEASLRALEALVEEPPG
jgi:2-C-methyl-D-erythritol 4-phosphate cytidylyltransferase